MSRCEHVDPGMLYVCWCVRDLYNDNRINTNDSDENCSH